MTDLECPYCKGLCVNHKLPKLRSLKHFISKEVRMVDLSLINKLRRLQQDLRRRIK